MERFCTDAARLVVAHGGSLSGEHGDGRARSALLAASAAVACASARLAFAWAISARMASDAITASKAYVCEYEGATMTHFRGFSATFGLTAGVGASALA